MDDPKTLEEARAYKYEISTSNPQGYNYQEGHCAFERPYMFFAGDYQCSRKKGHGPDGLYCKQHAEMVGD